jgi:hypothetical protein
MAALYASQAGPRNHAAAAAPIRVGRGWHRRALASLPGQDRCTKGFAEAPLEHQLQELLQAVQPAIERAQIFLVEAGEQCPLTLER